MTNTCNEQQRTTGTSSRKRRLQRTAAMCSLAGSALFLLLGGPGSSSSPDDSHIRSLSSSSTGGLSAATDSTAAASTSSSRRPNILFLLLDQWRYDWDGHHPQTPTGPLPLRVPFLEEMGRRGTRFAQAYVPSPFCAPSRACVASGMELDAVGVLTNHVNTLPTDTVTIYRLLRDAGGYHTMSAGKDDLYQGDVRFPFVPIDYGDATMDLGFSDAIRTAGKVKITRDLHSRSDMSDRRLDEPYRLFLEGTSVAMKNGTEIGARQAYVACVQGLGPGGGCDSSSFSESIYPDRFVRDVAIDLLERRRDADKDASAKPWFLQVNFPGPHHPIISTSKMAKSVMGRTWPPPFDMDDSNHWATMSCPQQQMAAGAAADDDIGPQVGGRCNYGAEIEYIDELMQTIVNKVEELGELDNTIVVVAGDHGDDLSDHGSTGKGKPWHGSVSVPLFVSGPGIKANAVFEGPVTTLDLGGTFLDFADVKELASGMTTASLRSILEGTAAAKTEEEDSSTSTGSGSPATRIGASRNRPHVSSGYATWRMVVKEMPTSPTDPRLTSYKLICCKAEKCPGAPRTATPFVKGEPWHILLYDAVRDPFDMEPLDVKRPDLVQELLPLLPEGWCR